MAVGYRWFVMDNASQWNSTSIGYVTTTALTIVWYFNELGSLYVNGLTTSNATVKTYDFNKSLILSALPYNSSYVFSKFDSSGVDGFVNPFTWYTAGNDSVWCLFADSGSGDSFRFVDRSSLFFILAIGSLVLLIFVWIVFKNRR